MKTPQERCEQSKKVSGKRPNKLLAFQRRLNVYNPKLYTENFCQQTVLPTEIWRLT